MCSSFIAFVIVVSWSTVCRLEKYRSASTRFIFWERGLPLQDVFQQVSSRAWPHESKTTWSLNVISFLSHMIVFYSLIVELEGRQNWRRNASVIVALATYPQKLRALRQSREMQRIKPLFVNREHKVTMRGGGSWCWPGGAKVPLFKRTRVICTMFSSCIAMHSLRCRLARKITVVWVRAGAPVFWWNIFLDAQRLKVLSRKSFGCKKWSPLGLSSKRWKMQLFRIRSVWQVGNRSNRVTFSLRNWNAIETLRSRPIVGRRMAQVHKIAWRPRTQPSPCVVVPWLEQINSREPVLKAKNSFGVDQLHGSGTWCRAQGRFCSC